MLNKTLVHGITIDILCLPGWPSLLLPLTRLIRTLSNTIAIYDISMLIRKQTIWEVQSVSIRRPQHFILCANVKVVLLVSCLNFTTYILCDISPRRH